MGEALARVGAQFVYEGETDAACARCKLRKACHDLDPHRPYRVTAVRDVRHKGVCTVFDGDAVRVAEVEPVPLRVTVPVAALRGTGYSKRWDECGAACPFKSYCNPAALAHGEMASIVDVGEPVDCKVGRELRFARVAPQAWKKR